MAVHSERSRTVELDYQGTVELDWNGDGYREAQSLLNRADSGRIELSEDDRQELNRFIRDYQGSQLLL